MRNRLLALGIAFCCMLSVGMTAGAAGSNPSVNFTADDKLVYEGVADGSGETVDLGETFKDIAPGESRTLTIDLKNNNAHTADFYMSTKTLEALEKSASALGAGYDIEMKAGSKTLYDSKVGGYASEAVAGSKEGLKAISKDLEDMLLVGTLSKGQTTSVTLKVTFDGEGMDNANVADYTLSDGKIQFDFRVGYEPTTGKKENKKIVTLKKQPIVVNIYDEVTPLAPVKTGDTAKIGVAIMIICAGVLLFVAGRRKKSSRAVRAIAPMLLALGLAGALGTTSMAAESETAKTYTVTYRPGNVGHFHGVGYTDPKTYDKTKDEIKTQAKAEAEAFANAFYRIDTDNTPEEQRTGITKIEVTDMGAIKLTVAKGSKVPAAPTSIVAEEGYKAALTSVWGPAEDATVTKNVDYVVDYVKLVDGVEYTIRFVDTAGNSVATDVIAYDNRTETVSYTAPITLVISGGAVYQLQTDKSAQKQSITLGDTDKNVITFVYSYVPSSTVTVTEYEYEDGGTIYNHVPGTTTTVVNPAIVTPAPGTQNQNNGQNAQQDQGEDNGENNGENAESDIPENEVPLDDTADDENSEENGNEDINASDILDDETVIEDEDTALSDEIKSNLPYALAAATLLLVAGSLIYLRRKVAMVGAADPEDNAEENKADTEE